MSAPTPAPVTWAELQQKLGLTLPLATRLSPDMVPSTLLPGASLEELMQRRCKDGERTSTLVQLAGTLLSSGFDLEETIAHCHRWNQNNEPPLDSGKINRTCESIHSTDQRNHPERYPQRLNDVPLFKLQAGRIDRYLDSPPPLRRWLLTDLVVLGRVGAVVAPGGSSKSQWLLQLAVSVATGIPLANHWAVGETGGVLVLFAEDDSEEIHRRLHRIQNHLKMAGHGPALAPLRERLFIFSTIGTDTLLTRKDVSGEVSATANVSRIAALAHQIPDLRLIVVDPASRFRGGEENSNEDATRFVEALETLAQQTGATVMLAHHTNKFSSTNGDVSQGASRGASGLTDGLRWQLNLNRPTDAQANGFGLPKEALGNYVAATVTKTNYSAIPDCVLLERGPDGYLGAVNATQARSNAEQRAVMAVMRVLDNESKPLSARTLEDKYGGLRGRLKMSKQRVRDAVKLGMERGYLDGRERKPLRLTPQGADILKCFPAPAADATRDSETAPRKKTQWNQ